MVVLKSADKRWSLNVAIKLMFYTLNALKSTCFSSFLDPYSFYSLTCDTKLKKKKKKKPLSIVYCPETQSQGNLPGQRFSTFKNQTY